MINMKVTTDLKALESQLNKLKPENAAKVIKSSVKKLHKDGMVKAHAEVAKVYDLRRSNINRYIDKPKTRSKNGEIVTTVTIRTRYASLLNFATNASVSSSIIRKKRHTKVIVVKIKRGQSAHTFRHAFMMNARRGNNGATGNIGMFERVIGKKSSTGKDKIKRLNTVGPISMFRNVGFDAFSGHVETNARAVFEKKLKFYFKKESKA